MALEVLNQLLLLEEVTLVLFQLGSESATPKLRWHPGPPQVSCSQSKTSGTLTTKFTYQVLRVVLGALKQSKNQQHTSPSKARFVTKVKQITLSIDS
jgi:hypothetical protein